VYLLAGIASRGLGESRVSVVVEAKRNDAQGVCAKEISILWSQESRDYRGEWLEIPLSVVMDEGVD